MKRNIATLLLFASVLSASGFSLFGPKPGRPHWARLRFMAAPMSGRELISVPSRSKIAL